MGLMKLNIIHDARRQEKYEPLISELQSQGVSDYEVWPCIVLPDVVKSINASHKMIVKDAKDKGEKEVCIAEDDLMFTSPTAWDYFLFQKPDEFDLYLASTYVIENPLRYICGFHLYVVAERFYDRFLSVPDESHIDTVMNDIGGNFKFCYPFPALQRPGFSANNKMQVNYNAVVGNEHLFNEAIHNF